MGLNLGLASSHAPSLFLESEKWPLFYEKLIKDVPQPLGSKQETMEVLQGFVDRIHKNFEILKQQLIEYKPDALIVVGDDQEEMFSDALLPAMAVFLGETISGTTSLPAIGESPAENHIEFTCDPELANFLLEGLIEEGFDLAYSRRAVPMGRPEIGLGHAFTRPCNSLGVRDMKIPIVPLFVNTYHPPLISGQRSFDLGRAIRKVVDRLPQRIAIYGSGGLSHDPRGPRAGWVDEPLDRWILKQIESGNNEALAKLFTFDSDSMRGGTGEIRTWITVGGAFEHVKANIVDYFVAHHAVTGLGFAYWSE